jgi:hypothetical protein
VPVATPADRRQTLVPVRSREHPWGHVVARDPHSGRLIRCPCGARRWTAYGQAAHHGASCPVALARLADVLAAGRRHAEARELRQRALAAALRRAGRRGATAADLALVLGRSPGHVRALLRAAEATGRAERRGRLPARWRAR